MSSSLLFLSASACFICLYSLAIYLSGCLSACLLLLTDWVASTICWILQRSLQSMCWALPQQCHFLLALWNGNAYRIRLCPFQSFQYFWDFLNSLCLQFCLPTHSPLRIRLPILLAHVRSDGWGWLWLWWQMLSECQYRLIVYVLASVQISYKACAHC